MSKKIDIELSTTQRSKVSLFRERIHDYRQRHQILAPAFLVLTIAAPFLGLWFDGVTGAWIGVLASLVLILLGDRAMKRVREIRESGGRDP